MMMMMIVINSALQHGAMKNCRLNYKFAPKSGVNQKGKCL